MGRYTIYRRSILSGFALSSSAAPQSAANTRRTREPSSQTLPESLGADVNLRPGMTGVLVDPRVWRALDEQMRQGLDLRSSLRSR
jgi:hypothetical protein